MEENKIPPVMYLAQEHWSPRYDNAFFTVKMDGIELLTSPPNHDSVGTTRQQIMEGNKNHPAYYYKVEVFCAHTSRTFLRRYSQFHWLYKQLVSTRPPPRDGETALEMPPGTCFFQAQDEAFAQHRLEQLRDFLRDLLQRPGYATDPRVVIFLELNELSA